MSQLQRTFAMIKPDAVSRACVGEIIAMVEKAGFRIVAMRKTQFTVPQAEAFYAVHRERPFFGGLIKFMTEGPAVVMVLEKENAIDDWRKLMGATNPANAEEGTIRKKFASDIERNCVHGSDAPATAAVEVPFFFSSIDLL
jgi:nucleoside-diphosphate kinase